MDLSASQSASRATVSRYGSQRVSERLEGHSLTVWISAPLRAPRGPQSHGMDLSASQSASRATVSRYGSQRVSERLEGHSLIVCEGTVSSYVRAQSHRM